MPDPIPLKINDPPDKMTTTTPTTIDPEKPKRTKRKRITSF
jgi:hypothetical protein